MSPATENAINYNFEIPTAPSRYLRALLAYVKAMESWNYDDIMACFDDSLVHRILPASLEGPVRSKEVYAEFFKGMLPLFAGNKFNVSPLSAADILVVLIDPLWPELVGDNSRSHRVRSQDSGACMFCNLTYIVSLLAFKTFPLSSAPLDAFRPGVHRTQENIRSSSTTCHFLRASIQPCRWQRAKSCLRWHW